MANLLERLEQLRAAVAEAAPGNARAALEAALAEQLILRGEYAEALMHLGAARRAATAPPLREHVELSMGVALLRRGETERAEAHLERALLAAKERRGEGSVELAHLGEVYRRRGESERARAAFVTARAAALPADLAARVQTGLAWLAVEGGNLDEAESLALAAVDASGEESAAAAACEALQSLAEIRLRKGDAAAAERLCRQAIDTATRAELNRELAEAYFAYSHVVGRAGDALPQKGREPPASWLARAQELFRSHGALADLERVREAFRRFGRRATDHVAAVEFKSMIDDLKAARLTVAREAHRLADAVDHAGRRLEDELPAQARAGVRELRRDAGEAEQAVTRSVETMSVAEGRVFGAIQAVISERENIRTLLDLCRSLNEQRDYGRLVSEIARMAAQLTGADRALIALAESDGLAVRAAWHITDLADDAAWKQVLADLSGPTLVEGDSTARRGSEELRLGRALATPLRQGDKIFGAVYVDKDLGGGLFTPHELDLLSIFCAQAATTLENVRVAEQLRLAARSRTVTLEAISDGVISFDRHGVITSINAVAARILAVPPDAEAAIARFPDLAFLRAALERGDELDGRVTRVGAGEYLLNLRLVLSDTGEAVGGVATLAEMKRVQAIAQRIVGAQARYSFSDLIGDAPALRRRLQLARAAARSGSSVLITGESGTGKEVLAQAIHNESARSAGPFVGINCSAIPRELIESELFGYEGGAFTGAKKGGHPGKFELAEGGTILLDEIGDMPIEMQAKLLRVLQERRVQRIGGRREVELDARVIATTNRDLEEGVARGQFRSDLLFRLKVIEIALPPLRERASDVPVLAAHFLALFAARLGKSVRALAPPVAEAFLQYPWPGNIRELENVLEGEVNLVEPDQLVLDQIPEALRARRRAPSSSAVLSEELTLDEAERELLVKALSRHGGNIPDVARTLGVSRGTVYNKLHRFQLDASRFRAKS